MPGCYPPVVLHVSEHALDGVAAAVKGAAEGRPEAPVAFGRDVGRAATQADLVPDRAGVASMIGGDDGAFRQQRKQGERRPAVGCPTAGAREGARSAALVGRGVGLAAASASTDPDCLAALPPPFSGAGAAVSLQRRAVEQHFRRRPAFGRQHFEDLLPDVFARPPDEAVVERLARAVARRRVDPPTARAQPCTIPETTRRSSTRSLPCVSVGSTGASRTIRASLSHKSSDSKRSAVSELESALSRFGNPGYWSGAQFLPARPFTRGTPRVPHRGATAALTRPLPSGMTRCSNQAAAE